MRPIVLMVEFNPINTPNDIIAVRIIAGINLMYDSNSLAFLNFTLYKLFSTPEIIYCFYSLNENNYIVKPENQGLSVKYCISYVLYDDTCMIHQLHYIIIQ